jgi:hypothetical protein
MSSMASSYTQENGLSSEIEYRTVSRTAVLGLVFGIVGLLAILYAAMLFLPAVGLIFSLLALASFRKYPEELTGKPIAWTAFLLSGLLLIVAPIRHAYIYATEVPEGYERISFSTLTSPKGAPDMPTAEALELNGKQVFVKGYIHPSSISANSSKYFVLVPDLGTCCFGGQPPLTHMIEVTLTGNEGVRHSFRKFKLAGKLQVDTNLKPISGLQGVYYQLRADHVE